MGWYVVLTCIVCKTNQLTGFGLTARMQNKPGYANLTPKGRRDTLKHRDGRSQAKILDVETTDAQISSAKR